MGVQKVEARIPAHKEHQAFCPIESLPPEVFSLLYHSAILKYTPSLTPQYIAYLNNAESSPA
tara:strand:+ start:425 stop:610 length:186 start_codon:yes stop_codon:yes gene_type:complete